jgi:hypothetical protein
MFREEENYIEEESKQKNFRVIFHPALLAGRSCLVSLINTADWLRM